MNDLISKQVFSGWLLITCFLVFFVGGMLFTGRAIWKWPVASTPAYLSWERGFFIAAMVVLTAGLALLERRLEAAGEVLLAPAGMVIFLVGAVLILVAETFFIGHQEWNYAAVVASVILTFLGEAVFGAALLRAGLLPGWVGWAAILWNLGWLIILPIVRPNDMYYPWLHYMAPLLIGIALIARA
jgi:hypothetical protein